MNHDLPVRDQRTSIRGWLPAIGAVAAIAAASLIGLEQVRSTSPTYRGVSILYFFPGLVTLWVALLLEIRSRPYSLHLVHLVALYIFMVVAPLFQTAYGSFPIPESYARVRPEIVLKTNLVVMLWTITYLLAYYIAAQRFARRLPRRFGSFLSREVPPRRIDLVLFLAIPALAYLVVLGLGGVTTRGEAYEQLSADSSQAIQIIHARLVRSFPFVALAAALMSLRLHGARIVTIALLPIVTVGILYADNPLASPRYWQVSLVAGLFAPQVLRGRKTGVTTLWLMLAGILLLPGLGASRHAESAASILQNISSYFVSPVDYFTQSGDVSAYGMLTLVWPRVDAFGHTYGSQILSALLFWVPRQLWPGKSVGTGQLLCNNLGFDFTNRAAPIIAEPLIDFGWIGVPFVAVLFAALLALLDRIYYGSRTGSLRVIDTFYPFLIGLTVFLTRGDMISSLAGAMGFVISAVPLMVRLGSTRRPHTTSATAPATGGAGPT